METTAWIPMDVEDREIAFGVGVARLMPRYDDIPREFKDWNGPGRWNKVVSDWFYRGLKDVEWVPKPGIDPQKALRHLKVIMGSWDPRHEHKEAAVAYLLSLWFEDVKYTPAK
jgi:hypothetical protein